ncbi:MAG: DapH/DapD/GlmU-related protein [Nanoarchaeota archaeon]|nr:DapH/DapD/GlmU-related protein [Nanoarchaeota archaeon]
MAPKIYKNVEIGEGTIIEDGCIIGLPPKGKTNGELKTIIGKGCLVRSGTYVYAGNIIGDNFQTGNKANIRENNIIGDNVSIGTLSIIEHRVKIEDNVRIHTQVFVPEFSLLKKGCWLGPNVVLTNAFHPLCPKVKECLKGPVIEEGAIIGANSTLMPHIIIGKRAIVGAASLVTKSVDGQMVVAGNPAKPIKKISDLKCKFPSERGIVKPYGDDNL